MNLGDPAARPQEAGSHEPKGSGDESREVRLRHCTVEPSNDRGGKGVAEYEECKWG